MRFLYRATMVWGVVSLLMLVIERLALTDIFHGEPDLSLEWTAVHVSFVPIVLFHVLGVTSAWIAAKRLGRHDRGRGASGQIDTEG